ncbi:MAG: dephospho-CoA kinase [Chloroflexota bacterium]|nr:dephospho-CoA kinase [Chloroflexota bacterium]
MLVIGLTGGIGTGKSEVSRMLQRLGAVVIDADRVGHEVYRPQTSTWHRVVEAFGEGILAPSGEIDRKKLGSIVFADQRALARLNAIVHPVIREELVGRLEGLRGRGTPVVVVEAAVLIEAGWDTLMDEVWVTHSREDAAVARVARRNSLSPEEVRRRVRAQLPFEERRMHADVVIENDGDLEALRQKVEALWDSRVKGRSLKDAGRHSDAV